MNKKETFEEVRKNARKGKGGKKEVIEG